ncbi:MAG: peptide-methionine (R)-S-oxide reductase MsrB [Myxococcota bacterium]
MKGRGVLRAVSLMAPLIVSTLGCSTTSSQPPDGKKYEVSKTDAQWRKALSPEQFRILRQKGTERAFTGQYWNEKQKGIYRCAGCNQPLFSSEHKFRSGTGWPSYYQAIEPGLVDTISDTSFGMVRTEILCSRCGGHLGHVFRDGPEPTGLRYCVNSASLVLDTKADRSVVDK